MDGREKVGNLADQASELVREREALDAVDRGLAVRRSNIQDLLNQVVEEQANAKDKRKRIESYLKDVRRVLKEKEKQFVRDQKVDAKDFADDVKDLQGYLNEVAPPADKK